MAETRFVTIAGWPLSGVGPSHRPDAIVPMGLSVRHRSKRMPDHDALEQQLAIIEARLARLESLLKLSVPEPAYATQPPAASAGGSACASPPASPAPLAAPFAMQEPDNAARPRRGPASTQNLGTTQLLGWSGATALVFAAIYLIRLGIDSGWLTPVRQLVLATMGAGGLIGGGLLLRRHDRQYAAFLPAAGVVVLFAAVYAAHLHYGLIGGQAAALGVVAIALLALGLGTLFDSELYALFAVLGSYTAPLFLPDLRGTMSDLAIYFSVWSLVFSAYALKSQRRAVYLLAMYLALIVFSLLFMQYLHQSWEGALLFQALQFGIFLTTAVLFSVRLGRPLERAEAWAHFPALLLFYALQYDLLDRHLHAWAPWIALGTAAVLLGAYLLARMSLGTQSQAGRALVSAYIALVLFHAVYLDLLPQPAQPWVGLAILGILPWLARKRENSEGLLTRWPFLLAGGLILLLNLANVLLDRGFAQAPVTPLLQVLYPAMSYAAYLVLRRDRKLAQGAQLLLALAHLSAMTAAVRLIDIPALASVAWLAVATLALAAGFVLRDRSLGQSSLFLFLLAGLKIMLFDLANTAPLLRVVVLLVLGLSLYAGGWVYRKLPQSTVGVSE